MGAGSRGRGGRRRQNRRRAAQVRRNNRRQGRVYRHHGHLHGHAHHAQSHMTYLPPRHLHGSHSTSLAHSRHTRSTRNSPNSEDCKPKTVGIAAALFLILPGILLTGIGATGLLAMPAMVVGSLVLAIGFVFTTTAYVLHVKQQKKEASQAGSDPEAGNTVPGPVSVISTTENQANSSMNSVTPDRGPSSFQLAPMGQATNTALDNSYNSLPTGSVAQPPPPPTRGSHGSAPILTMPNPSPPPIFGIQTFSKPSAASLRQPGPIAQSSPMTQHGSFELNMSFPSESSVDPVFRNVLPTYDQLYPGGGRGLGQGTTHSGLQGTANLGFDSLHSVSLPSYNSSPA